MLAALLLLVTGIGMLTLGADRFVDGAVRLSHSLGVSAVLIGALVVGLGTSVPELVVSGLAASRDELELAVGNVVGSNVANVTLVLGLAALISPLRTRLQIVLREGALMVAAVAALAVVLWDGRLATTESAVLLGAMVVAGWLLTRWSSPGGPGGVEGRAGWLAGLGWAALGLGATVAGADLLVRGAIRLATELEITAAFVGLVVVAIGTSLPEAATAIVAARRGHADLVMGNVLGSNIFNSLVVAGAAGLIGPGQIGEAFGVAAVIMVVAAVLAGVFHITGRRLTRLEGGVLLAGFAAFSVFVA